MGTDIHFYVETFKKDKGWALAPDQVKRCDRCGGTGVDPEINPCGNCGRLRAQHEPSGGRCLFDSTQFSPTIVGCLDQCYQGSLLYPRYGLQRDYRLFAVLSGIRGQPVPKTQVRGIPSNATPLLIHWAKSPDYHTHSWYGLDELDDLLRGRLTLGGVHYTPQNVLIVLDRMRQLTENPKHTRAVFWYDN